MKKYLITIILSLLLALESFSQGALSGNEFLLASPVKVGSYYKIYIHNVLNKELTRILEFNPKLTTPIKKITFDRDGFHLAAFSNGSAYIFDVMNGKQLFKISNAKKVIFTSDGQYAIVWRNNFVLKYNLNKKTVVKTYSIPSGKTVAGIQLSPKEDKLIVQTKENKIYIYKINNSSASMEIIGSGFRVNKKDNKLVVKTPLSNKVKIATYNLATLKAETALFSSSVLKPYKIDEPGQPKLIKERTSLSPNGIYVAFYTVKENSVKIYIFNTKTKKLVWIVNNLKDKNNQLYPIHWSKEFIMIAEGKNLTAGEYNLKTQNPKVPTLFLRMDTLNANKYFQAEYQKKHIKISPNYHIAALQTPKGLYVRDTRIPNVKMFYKNTRFVAFYKGGEAIFVEKDGVINVITYKSLKNSLVSNRPTDFIEFNRKLNPRVPETYLPDSKPPAGYAYFFVNNKKQIVSLDTQQLHLALRSVKVNRNEVEIQLNLVDKNGNIYLGSTDPSWKFVWCNVVLQDPNHNVTQVKDYTVQEKNINEPTAYAIVLDHSGSMGDSRANVLQKGAFQLIQKRIGKNAFLLIKYDDKVKLEVPLTTNKTPFVNKLRGIGMTGYGGKTALIDATYMAVKQLAEDTTYKRKVVLLFTDGYENASMYSKDVLLYEALKNNIEIDVIGFGKKVNNRFLKSIAYATGGIYSHIYKSSDLLKIFNDVDLKTRHYYSIKFKTNAKGKHIALIQLCQDIDKQDSIWVSFDTKASEQPLDKREVSPPIKKNEIKTNLFKPYLITADKPLKPVKSKKILTEFNNIHFPNILFETGSDKILKNDERGIDEIVAFMKKYPYVYLEIDGHTDNVGTPEFNMELSIKRAEAAKRLIVAKGIAPGRIITKGFGETKPIASNDTEEGRRLNRRIEFKIFYRK